MKTILLPVDFSAASANAARYAAALSALPEYLIGRIILLNSYYVSIYEQILPTPDFVQVGTQQVREMRIGIRKRLGEVREAMLKLVGQSVTIECMESEEPVLRSILNAIVDRKPDLLLIGSGGLGDIAEQVIGIARISPVPVLIVPGEKSFDGIHKVLIHADPCSRRSEPDDRFRAANAGLEKYLTGIQHEIYYSDKSDTLLGILEFAQDGNIDMIVALPGKHSIFYKLTHHSISEALVRNAEMPVLILK